MEFIPASNQTIKQKDSSGIALFMVMAAVSVLAMLVTEFSYLAHIHQQIAFGGLDQIKAHYLAKAGLKLSLLRLNIFQQAQALAKNQPASIASPGLLAQIWSFPFIYPIPVDVLGLTGSDKTAVEKFQNDSNLEGNYSIEILSDSTSLSLNQILPQYAPSSVPTSVPSSLAGGDPPADPKVILQNYLNHLLTQKMDSLSTAREEIDEIYLNLRMDDLMDQIVGWADFSYVPRLIPPQGLASVKRAPFYSLTELHMLPLMNDLLYDLFAQQLTAQPTHGININTISATVLRALIPEITPAEALDFIKQRDAHMSQQFSQADDFYKYLLKNMAAFRNQQSVIDRLKGRLQGQKIFFTVNEEYFRIKVSATVNEAIETIDAWVKLTPRTTDPNDSGLRITYMKIL